jgi:hypothetical protein
VNLSIYDPPPKLERPRVGFGLGGVDVGSPATPETSPSPRGSNVDLEAPASRFVLQPSGRREYIALILDALRHEDLLVGG